MSTLLCELTFYLPVYIEWLNHHVQRSEAWFFIRLIVYANELIFGAFTLKQCSSRLVIEILKIRCRLWPWLWLRLRCWQWLSVKIIMSRAIKREPISPVCVVGIGIKSWLNCLEKLSFFGYWKSLPAASKCRKTHPCNNRISKFSGETCSRTPLGGKALRALPILCPGVKLSCPPVQNLNEPSDSGAYKWYAACTPGLDRNYWPPLCMAVHGNFWGKWFLASLRFHRLQVSK